MFDVSDNSVAGHNITEEHCRLLHSLIISKETGGGHGGRVVTLSPPTSEAGVQFTALPQVAKLVVACRWSAVYSTEP